MLVQVKTRCRLFIRTGCSGFSYIEILISFALISFTLLALLHMTWSQASILFYSKQNRAAYTLIYDAIQRLKINSTHLKIEQANAVYFADVKLSNDDCEKTGEHICYQSFCSEGQLAQLDRLELYCGAVKYKLDLDMFWQAQNNSVFVQANPINCKSSSCFDVSMSYELGQP